MGYSFLPYENWKYSRVIKISVNFSLEKKDAQSVLFFLSNDETFHSDHDIENLLKSKKVAASLGGL